MSADVSVTSARNRTLLVVGNLLWLAALVAAQGCSQATPPSAGSSPVPEVVQIKLSLSNVFLIRTARPVFIDGGSPKDLAALTGALARNGLRTADIALVILTHAHSDHAGLAAELRGAGAKVALGQGHADRARNLENIKTVLKQPVRPFYLGHGGPVDREAVIAGFATGPN